MGRDPKYLHSAERRRRYPKTAPRPMVGLWSQLTPQQRAAALAYDGPELVGDEQFRLKVPSSPPDQQDA